MSIPSLEAKSNFVQKIVDGDLDMENLDLSLIANVVQQDNKKEKRKQKRGPNKWMPMRRTVDPEVQNRILKFPYFSETIFFIRMSLENC